MTNAKSTNAQDIRSTLAAAAAVMGDPASQERALVAAWRVITTNGYTAQNVADILALSYRGTPTHMVRSASIHAALSVAERKEATVPMIKKAGKAAAGDIAAILAADGNKVSVLRGAVKKAGAKAAKARAEHAERTGATAPSTRQGTPNAPASTTDAPTAPTAPTPPATAPTLAAAVGTIKKEATLGKKEATEATDAPTADARAAAERDLAAVRKAIKDLTAAERALVATLAAMDAATAATEDATEEDAAA